MTSTTTIRETVKAAQDKVGLAHTYRHLMSEHNRMLEESTTFRNVGNLTAAQERVAQADVYGQAAVMAKPFSMSRLEENARQAAFAATGPTDLAVVAAIVAELTSMATTGDPRDAVRYAGLLALAARNVEQAHAAQQGEAIKFLTVRQTITQDRTHWSVVTGADDFTLASAATPEAAREAILEAMAVHL